jgi:probable rRNA maturation factor
VAVEVRCETARGAPLTRALRRDAVRILSLLDLTKCELSLVIVSDREIRRLNREYRGKDKATDVLSFPLTEADEIVQSSSGGARRNSGESSTSLDPSAPPCALGDVVISAETAGRQARTLGERPSARMRTLLIHGTLHLLGYVHEGSATEARRMFAKEHELAERLAGRSSITRDAKTRAEWSPAAMLTRRRSRTTPRDGARSG